MAIIHGEFGNLAALRSKLGQFETARAKMAGQLRDTLSAWDDASQWARKVVAEVGFEHKRKTKRNYGCINPSMSTARIWKD